jgi:hypothetical protein
LIVQGTPARNLRALQPFRQKVRIGFVSCIHF